MDANRTRYINADQTKTGLVTARESSEPGNLGSSICIYIYIYRYVCIYIYIYIYIYTRLYRLYKECLGYLGNLGYIGNLTSQGI